MALTDPQAVTLSGVAFSLPRVGNSLGVYRDTTGELQLSVKHYDAANRSKHVVRLERRYLVTNPTVPAQNMRLSAHVQQVIDVPAIATVAEAAALIKAYGDWLSASSYALATKIAGGES